jgi:hypothetical protein
MALSPSLDQPIILKFDSKAVDVSAEHVSKLSHDG